MAPTPGSRLGLYAITAKLGAGGMGEVYRATDPRLGREVAIKVLPPEVAADPERLARFQREAQLLASLNHPSIAALYGLDEAEGKPFLVMELVEGDDLAERLTRGPIPIDEALEIAKQISGALEAAHEKGIVHRDLKPANVRVTEDGKVKILDFGLARAYGLEEPGKSALDSANSPTMTHVATAAGMILGTAAYMSPEQARGKAVDKRADIWAFGVVLHEMLTGKPLFAGETVSDTLAAVLTREPDPGNLPPQVPPRVQQLLARCLRKDPRERLRDIGDARIELSEPAAPAPAALAPGEAKPSRKWISIAAVLGVLAALAALAGGMALGRRSAPTALPMFRALTFARGYVQSARFAPDQQTVIYGAAIEARPLALFSTRTDGHDSRPIEVGSADIAGIARDGRMALLQNRHHTGNWLRIGTLATVSLSGGTPREILEEVYGADISPDGEQFAVVVADAGHQILQYPIGKELFRTAGWIGAPRISPDGTKVAFIDHPIYGDDVGLVKVAEPGGGIVPLTERGEQYVHGLCWSPDGDEVWFSSADPDRGGELWRIVPGKPPRLALRGPGGIRVQDVARDGSVLLLTDEARVTLAGQLAGDEAERIYTWWDQETTAGISADGTMYAGDNPSLVVDNQYGVYFRRGTEPPVQIGMGAAAGLSPDGKLVFTTDVLKEHPSLVARPVGAGQPKTIDLGGITPQAGAGYPVSFSADGRRIAFVGNRPGAGLQAWVVDLAGGPPRAVSPEGAFSAVLSLDGSKVAVSDPRRGVLVVPAVGGEPAPLGDLPKDHVALAWTPDGSAVLSWDRTLPPRIYRTRLSGGPPELVREIVLPDPAGIIYGWLTVSLDGRYHLLRSRRVLSQVMVVSWGTGTRKN